MRITAELGWAGLGIVEPLIYMTDEKNVLRKDVVKDTVTKEEALQNAPQRDSDYFKVPKVIKK